MFSIAPGQGNKPIPLLTDKLFEELSNPDKFPFGKGGFADTERHTKLTLRKYVNARLLDQMAVLQKISNTYLACSMRLNINRLEILSVLPCGRQEDGNKLAGT